MGWGDGLARTRAARGTGSGAQVGDTHAGGPVVAACHRVCRLHSRTVRHVCAAPCSGSSNVGNKGLNIEMILKRQEPPDLGAWGILSQHLLRVMKESREVLMKAEVRAVQRVRVRARLCGCLRALFASSAGVCV